MFFKFIFLLFTTALLGCSVEPKEEVAEYIVKPEVFEAVELVETVPTKRFYSTITGSDVVDVASLSTARIKSLSALPATSCQRRSACCTVFADFGDTIT
ncbi:hypothetical protein [Pseudoalteromonas sp. PS5]|uniref:hypothetical protein n=1 Tax=Pseudoalteromonas sp. PS5 TaxID=1437473 RepID=UPI000FFEA811|nr:hypothetical protein [Pseudoalteromonas sp. PS5]